MKHRLVLIVALVLAVTSVYTSACTPSRAARYAQGHENAVAKTKFTQYAALHPESVSELEIHNELTVPISFKLVIDDAPDAWLFGTVDAQGQSAHTVPNLAYRFQVFMGDLQDQELYFESSPFTVGRQGTITVYSVDRWNTTGLVDPFTLSEMNGAEFWR